MKNIQVIDGAINCAYSVYEADDGAFATLFPAIGQDVEFIEDVADRLGEDALISITRPLWARRVNKRDVNGIHGTLFYGLPNKKPFYPTKRESDLDQRGSAHRQTSSRTTDAGDVGS